MLRRSLSLLSLALLFALTASPQYGAPKSPPPKDKTVWNYDGGLVLMTDGSIPDGPCFRLTGRVTAPGFFDNLKRIDTGTAPVIHRDHDIVTEFPDHLQLLFELYDQPCSTSIDYTGPRVYLNKDIVSSLHLRLFWKHGVELRPAQGAKLNSVEARLIPPYASELAKDLPEKFEWWFDLDVPSAGVPVTDSLVVVLLTPDRHIAARAAARL